MDWFKFIVNKRFRFEALARQGFYDRLPDDAYLRKRFKIKTGRDLDLQNPRTFTEKLQWLKLYNRREEYVRLVDKCEVKRFVAERVGEEYVIPTLGVYNRFDEIDFDALPERFVLKCAHDSGGLVICKDKKTLDKSAARKKIKAAQKKNFYYLNREWPYKNVKPRIIAEEYMEDEATAELRDYKFFCFDGEAKALFIATDRQTPGEEVKFDFFDMDFRWLDVRNGHENAKTRPAKPATFDKMKELSEILSQGMPHARVDFYEVNGKVYFGEITFFHFSGMMNFDPIEWDYTFGSWLKLRQETSREERL